MASGAVSEFTDSNFEDQVVKSDLPVLVDFWAEWCMPCRMLAGTIQELAQQYDGKVLVGKMDTDANKEIPTQFKITAIPTVILFQKGQVVRKFVGVTPKQEFEAELNKLAD